MHRLILALTLWFFGSSISFSAADAQTVSASSNLRSPDGRWVLIWQKRSDYDYSLNLSDLKTQGSREVLGLSQPQMVGWGPDGEWFFVNAHESSDWENAFVYNTATLHRVDLARLITSHDRTVRNYRAAGSHMYTVAEKWVDAQSVRVSVTGHTDSPAHDFSFSYLFKLPSSVTKLR